MCNCHVQNGHCIMSVCWIRAVWWVWSLKHGPRERNWESHLPHYHNWWCTCHPEHYTAWRDTARLYSLMPFTEHIRSLVYQTCIFTFLWAHTCAYLSTGSPKFSLKELQLHLNSYGLNVIKNTFGIMAFSSVRCNSLLLWTRIYLYL